MKNRISVLLICIVSLIIGGCSSTPEPGADLEGIDKEVFDLAVTIEDQSAKSTIELETATAYVKNGTKKIIITYDIYYDNGAIGSNIIEFYKSKDDDSDEYSYSDYSQHSTSSLQAQVDELFINQYIIDIETYVTEGKTITYDEFADFEDGVIASDVDVVNEELVKYQELDK